MPPLSTFDNNTSIISFEPEHSYSPSPSAKKAPLNPEPRRTVAFSQTVSVRKTMHVNNNYSDNEVDACWYNAYEFDMMRKEVGFAAKLLQNGMLEQDTGDKYCRRGAERLERNVALQRLRNRLAASDAVLEEQKLRWEEDICEPEYIARVYKATSASSQASAHAITLKDELDAML